MFTGTRKAGCDVHAANHCCAAAELMKANAEDVAQALSDLMERLKTPALVTEIGEALCAILTTTYGHFPGASLWDL